MCTTSRKNPSWLQSGKIFQENCKILIKLCRIGDHKLLWGSQPEKDIWFPAQESVVDEDLCEAVKKRRTQADRNRSLSEARGMETMDVLNLDIDEDKEYAEEYEYLVRIQEIDLEEQDGNGQTQFEEEEGSDEE